MWAGCDSKPKVTNLPLPLEVFPQAGDPEDAEHKSC
jgi:hypothetical protein